MAKADPHSATWQAVQKFIEQQRSEAIEALRAGSHSDHQRGRLDLLDELEQLPARIDYPVTRTDTYST